MTQFTVRVTPRASKNEIKLDGDSITIRTTAAPTDGQANAAVIELLAKKLKIAKSKITLYKGESSRQKTFSIEDLTQEEILQRLRES